VIFLWGRPLGQLGHALHINSLPLCVLLSTELTSFVLLPLLAWLLSCGFTHARGPASVTRIFSIFFLHELPDRVAESKPAWSFAFAVM